MSFPLLGTAVPMVARKVKDIGTTHFGDRRLD